MGEGDSRHLVIASPRYSICQKGVGCTGTSDSSPCRTRTVGGGRKTPRSGSSNLHPPLVPESRICTDRCSIQPTYRAMSPTREHRPQPHPGATMTASPTASYHAHPGDQRLPNAPREPVPAAPDHRLPAPKGGERRGGGGAVASTRKPRTPSQSLTRAEDNRGQTSSSMPPDPGPKIPRPDDDEAAASADPLDQSFRATSSSTER